MHNNDDRDAVINPVLREALDRIEKEREGRCAFPFWSNWGNWRNWRNWGNGWRNGW